MIFYCVVTLVKAKCKVYRSKKHDVKNGARKGAHPPKNDRARGELCEERIPAPWNARISPRPQESQRLDVARALNSLRPTLCAQLLTLKPQGPRTS